MRRKDEQNVSLSVKDNQNKQQDQVKAFNEDMETSMFGYCEEHPSCGYQYFDTEEGRPLCILDIVKEQEEREKEFGTKNMS